MSAQTEPGAVSQASPPTLQQLVDQFGQIFAPDEEGQLPLVTLAADEILFEQGNEASHLYLLASGTLGVRVTQPDGTPLVIDRLSPGAVVGEMALLSGRPRTATVFANEPAQLLQLSRARFEQLDDAEKARLVGKPTPLAARWQRLQLLKVVGNLFGELDTDFLHLLQERLVWQHLTHGDLLFRQGDKADGMYLVVSGRLRYVVTQPDAQPQISGEIGPGESVGEFALLSDETRSATVYAVRETNVVKMTPDVFEKLVRERPELMGTIARMLVERRQKQIRQPSRTTAVAGLNLVLLPTSPAVDVARFAAEMAAALKPHGAVLTLDQAEFDTLYGLPGAAKTRHDDPAAPAIVAWMDELETRHTFLIFIADPEPTAWTRRCLGQADRVLILATPEQDPAPGAVEQQLSQASVPVRTELILWHPPETDRPRNTAAWLDVRSLHTHHHVRQNDAEHMARLARRLSGNAIALVLSGGAARGFAHLGVHQALEELDIPIDYIGCTSMGAVIGAEILTHGKNAEIVRHSRQLAHPNAIFDRTLPLTSVMASTKVTRLTQRIYGDLQIEDQWFPFFCVASNLTTAEAMILDRGPVWRAVRCSLSIPGIFAPVMANGMVIVDGGVIDNFPARTMAQLCESDRIIGVNVSPYREKRRDYDFDTSISGWRILLSRLNPFRKPLRAPSLVGTLMRTLEINSVSRAREEEAHVDLLIHPDVKAFSTTEYDKFVDIAKVGYEAALEPLREWKARRLDRPDGD